MRITIVFETHRMGKPKIEEITKWTKTFPKPGYLKSIAYEVFDDWRDYESSTDDEDDTPRDRVEGKTDK